MSRLAFPQPTVVVGVGRFGLAVMDELAQVWAGLRLAAADNSRNNLRLMSVRARDESTEENWCEHELGVIHLAHYLDEGETSSSVLDFALLRTLGLIRYRDGSYQVAQPLDAGMVEIKDDEQGLLTDRKVFIARRRYFEWKRLSSDPIVSAECLGQLIQSVKDLDLFLTPLLNRVRKGHSPRALLSCIARCYTLREGRDPSPWKWLPRNKGRIPLSDVRDTCDSKLDKYLLDMPEPLPQWRDWRDGRVFPEEPAILIPECMLPSDSDPVSPFDPNRLLELDWQSTGWVNDRNDDRAVVFHPLPVSSFRQGLFDHDGRTFLPPKHHEKLGKRLISLAEYLRRGLVRLWLELSWEETAEESLSLASDSQEAASGTLRQSLEILRELVVRPLASKVFGDTLASVPERKRSDAERQLPLTPSSQLSSMVVEGIPGRESPSYLLLRRLAELGLTEGGELLRYSSPLLEDVPLDADESATDRDTLGSEDGADGARDNPQDVGSRLLGLPAFRAALNRHARELLGFALLSQYRMRPTRRSPRLTVFVIGDVSESFTRQTFRSILMETHAELLRSFTPILQSCKNGFDRSLCVTPILWTPHPADPFPGEGLDLNRCEEAAIIDAVQGIRHWVEYALPPEWCCISQVFVNSRVTDFSTLSLADSVRQTRDFISLQIRSDLSGDAWLRQTSVAPGHHLFASFSCYEIDFPALLCREYLANRLARDCFEAMKEVQEVPLEAPDRFAPPEVEGLGKAREALDQLTREAADHMARRVAGRIDPEPATPSAEILARFDEEFERSLKAQVQERWFELTGRQGKVDDMVDALRIRTSNLLSKQLDRVRAHSDGQIEEFAGTGGLKAAQAGFHMLRTATHDAFQEQEEVRRRKEALSLRHAIPDLTTIPRGLEEVVRAAERKPDLDPMRLGLLLWVLLGPVLGAPLAHALAYWLDLHRRPGPVELLLGPAGWIVGTLFLTLPAWALLRRHIRRRVQAVRSAINTMAAVVRRLLWGTGKPPEQEGPASLRSFLESRLELTSAIGARGFALRILERAVADFKLTHRLGRSIDIQQQILSRRNEDLGVRASVPGRMDRREELRNLFDVHFKGVIDHLIEPKDLHAYYDEKIRGRDEILRYVCELIKAAGGLDGWRERACLTDTERVLGYCRRQFEEIVEETVSDQHFFASRVGKRLVEFVARYYSILGFGAGFQGYEGLGTENVQILADASLVLNKELAQIFENARSACQDEFSTTRTMQIQVVPIRPNTAYMMSLVQGVRVNSMRNLRRFKSFRGQAKLSTDNLQAALGEPIDPLTGYEEFAQELRSFRPERESV